MSYIAINRMNLVANLRRAFYIRQNYFSSLVGTGDLSKADENKNEEELFQQIKNVNSPKDLFHIISSQGKVFNQRHIMGTLKILFEISKNNTDYVKSGNIIVHPSFENFCLILKKQSRTFHPNDIIEAIKTLSALGVKGDTVIFQYLLQLIRQTLNLLNMQEAMFLHFLLNKCESSPLLDSLKLAMPLVFQIKFASEIDTHDVPQLTEMLFYVTKNKLPENYSNSIMTCLLLNSKNIDFKAGKSIYHSLCFLKQNWDDTSNPFKKLFLLCSNILATNINQLDYQDLIRILNFQRECIINHNFAYNEKFANAIAKYAIDNNLYFKGCIQIARQLNRIAHNHFELIDYMSDMIDKNNNLITKSVVGVSFIYINSLSNCFYKPKSWDSISQLIRQSFLNNFHRYDFPWIRFAINLASLGVYDDTLLEYIFQEDCLNHIIRHDNLLDHSQLLTIFLAVKTFHPSYAGTLPAQSWIENCIKITSSREADPKMNALLEVKLGPKCVAKNVQMPNGLCVDFVINFENEHPTPFPDHFKQGTVHFDELNIKDVNNTVLIMNFHKGCYSMNLNRIRGSCKLIIDIMEEKGYNVIPLSLHDWNNLKDLEKTPYIMREINTITSVDKQYLEM